jgi:hypothetical protein
VPLATQRSDLKHLNAGHSPNDPRGNPIARNNTSGTQPVLSFMSASHQTRNYIWATQQC